MNVRQSNYGEVDFLSVQNALPDRNSLKESVQNLDNAEEEETLYICAEYL